MRHNFRFQEASLSLFFCGAVCFFVGVRTQNELMLAFVSFWFGLGLLQRATGHPLLNHVARGGHHMEQLASAGGGSKSSIRHFVIIDPR